MKNPSNWIYFLFFGALWGASEVIAGEALYRMHIPYVSVWLTAWALLVLSAARAFDNSLGSSTAIGAVASLFKLTTANPFYCHLLGIFLLGVAFDIAVELFAKRRSATAFRWALSGACAAYLGFALFALLITYVIRYEPWVAGGADKVLAHIFRNGTFAALLALGLTPLGIRAGTQLERTIKRKPRLSYAGAIAGTLLLWIVARAVFI